MYVCTVYIFKRLKPILIAIWTLGTLNIWEYVVGAAWMGLLIPYNGHHGKENMHQNVASHKTSILQRATGNSFLLPHCVVPTIQAVFYVFIDG